MSNRKVISTNKRLEATSPGFELLKPNDKRVGLIIENNTATALYLLNAERKPTDKDRTFSIPAHSTYFELSTPSDQMYKGMITFALANAVAGTIFVTENVLTENNSNPDA
jgi:hypothetical protein